MNKKVDKEQLYNDKICINLILNFSYLFNYVIVNKVDI